MRSIADTALGSIAGLTVVAAMFFTIWAARDSSARVQNDPDDARGRQITLHSARTDRAPVTHTTITPAQVRELRRK